MKAILIFLGLWLDFCAFLAMEDTVKVFGFAILGAILLCTSAIINAIEEN